MQNQNIDDVELYGFESELSTTVLTSLQLGCNYTYTHAEDKTNSSELINIPQHKLVPYLKYTLFDRWSVLADAEFDSKRYSSTDGVQVASGFTIANLKFG
ncbi:MAG: TonB-dependent receptor, partial [Desulfobacula sp.]